MQGSSPPEARKTKARTSLKGTQIQSKIYHSNQLDNYILVLLDVLQVDS